MFHRIAWPLIALVLAGCASPPAPIAAAACAVSDADRAWIDRALEAWRFSAREITGIGQVENFQALFFDDDCTLMSPNALNADARVTWTAAPHAGTITLPNGEEMPAGVTSFANAGDGSAFLVMSTPSVWRAGGVDNPGIGLETMMVAVLLHEGAHVAQSASYGGRMTALAEANNLPDAFNDDSIQQRFGEDGEFSASVARETDLFFEAAAAADEPTARRLANAARALMRARQARWYIGADAYYRCAEDIWLTFEGSGQWAGYQWVIHPRGANVPVSIAMPNFARRSRWWSQNEGLAIALTLDRLAGPSWRAHVFGDGASTVLELLDAALAEH